MTSLSAPNVHELLGRRLLADGMPFVFDPARSCGSLFHDAVSGRDYVDFFGFFASQPVGFGHRHLADEAWLAELGRWAAIKPSNSDVYTVPFAEFVQTFEEVAVPDSMSHLFFIEGGALAVENAMKVAFDWKTRLNRSRGSETPGDQILHFKDAFHGRSGYTLSVTNTDPNKTELFPQFDWPRVPNPFCSFPLEGDHLAATEAREAESLAAIRDVLSRDAARVAGILIEPIQAEGGDHHIRAEFFAQLRAIADEHDVLLIFDEVQTGLGGTGEMWCFQHFGVTPDIVAFGKKTQVCGIMATDRIDQVPDNVFEVSSRINSTWGGNLVDMIRAQRILEIYRDGNLLANVRERGAQLLAGVEALQARHPELVSNARGRGLFVAFDLPDGETRGRLMEAAQEAGLLVLGCGDRSVRFRPALDIDEATVQKGLALLETAAASLA